jgi:hypothetical protein
MQLAVSYDKNGQITLMFNPATLKNDKFTIGYQPAAGENHRVLDVPNGLEGKSIQDLSAMLHVNVKSAAPSLEARA